MEIDTAIENTSGKDDNESILLKQVAWFTILNKIYAVQTSIGVLSAEREVNPTMSLKYRVTPS